MREGLHHHRGITGAGPATGPGGARAGRKRSWKSRPAAGRGDTLEEGFMAGEQGGTEPLGDEDLPQVIELLSGWAYQMSPPTTLMLVLRATFLLVILGTILATAACSDDPIVTPTPEPLPTHTPLPFRGEWETTKDNTDPLTQLGEVQIVLTAKGVEREPALVIECREDSYSLYGLEVFIVWGGNAQLKTIYRQSRNQVEVRHRIGDNPVETSLWIPSNNGNGTFLPAGEISTMIKKLYDADEFVVESKTTDNETLVAVFEPAGLYWTMKPVLAACGREID